MRLNIADIKRDSKLQVRVRIDPETVQEYAQAIKNGNPLPPIDVWSEDEEPPFLLSDGWHRLEAAVAADREQIGAIVHKGGFHDALQHALSANHTHGLKRTQADKRNAVIMALGDSELEDWSLRDIADLCRVSHTFVANIKEEQREAAHAKRRGKQPVTEVKKKIRPKKSAPDQAHVDRLDLRKALRIIRSFPFPGGDVYQRIKINPDDIREMRLVWTWLGEALENEKENA